MCTSAADAVRARALKTAVAYLLISLFCVLFGAVYEVFSHDVFSFWMNYAFVVPLVGGTLPFLALSVRARGNYPAPVARNLYHAGIAALTVGCIFTGVLEIFGTTNALVKIYWLAGVPLVLLGLACHLARGRT